MKTLLSAFFGLVSCIAFAQDINMQNGTFTRCSGVLFDSGGNSVYSDNENYTLTICPQNAGLSTKLDFTIFDTEANSDTLTIFDGQSISDPSIGSYSGTTSPGSVQATNASGCLTLQFVSDTTTNSTGWSANISCFEPCQTIISQIDTAIPAANTDGYIRVCPNEQITLTGSGQFGSSGAGASYEWDLGDGTTQSGQTATFSYATPGVYFVNLNISDTNTSTYPTGCKNTNLINQVVQVAPPIDFTSTVAADTTLCFGESTTITGIAKGVSFLSECTPPVSGVTFLPDGDGAVYTTCVAIDCYESNQTLDAIDQLLEICVNIEHSFLGDLEIKIVSPSGQEVILHEYPSGGNLYLGEPNDDESTVAGVGADYCFSMSATTLLFNGSTVIAGSNPPSASVVPGVYLPVQSFSQLIGSPLNGDWCIEITDNQVYDNGYVFSWGLNFDPAIQPPEIYFTPAITSEAWDANSTITNTSGNIITVQPPSDGNFCYTYRVMDDFGCESTKEICIDVLPELIHANPNDLFVCDTTAATSVVFNLSQNDAIIFAPNTNPTDFVLTYHTSQAEADADTNPISATDAAAFSGVHGQIIYGRFEYLTSGCYEIVSFALNIFSEPSISSLNDFSLCDDAVDGDDTNGFATFDLSTKTPEVLGSQLASEYTVKFYYDQAAADAAVDGTEITTPIQNTSNPQLIFARLENKLNVDCFGTTSFQLIVNLLPKITTPPLAILICDTDGNGVEVFDFSSNASFVLGTQTATNFPISYHSNQADAEGNISPLPLPYQNTLVTETIWMRIADLTQSCYEVISFDIEVRSLPIANTPNDISLCDDAVDGDDTNGIVEFDLSTKTPEVLGSQLTSDYTVKFYYDQVAADAGVDGTQITTPIQNTTTPQVIFARLENKLNVDCFATTPFQLIVNPRPVVNAEVTLKQCDTDTDGISDFNLTQANQLISSDYTNETFTYYLSASKAEMGLLADQITTPTIYTNPTPVTSIVYSRAETTHGCFRVSKVNLVVGATLIPSTFQLEYFVCDDTEVDNNNSNGVAAFDFTDATAQVLSQLPTNQNLTVSYYTTEVDALAETNPIPDITKHRNTASPTTQNIYARVDSNDVNACLGLAHHITLNVDPLPESNTVTDYILCSDTTQTNFDLTTKDTELIAGQAIPILISYHLSEQHAINNIPIPNPTTYPNTSNPQTIYVRAQFDPDNNMNLDVRECVRTDISFQLQVNLNPVLFTPDPIIECNDQVTTLYDLTLRETQITNNDPTIVLTYFETQQDLDTNNPIPNPTTYTNTTFTKTILVLATGANQCTKTISLELTTVLYANVNTTPTPLEECEIDNNGFDYFDLTLRETEILNGLNPADFEISYYEDQMDAQSGNTNNIPDPTNFENTNIFTQEIYVRVKQKLNPCFTIIPLTIIVNPVPEIGILDRYMICLNKNDQVINPVTQPFLPIPPIDTQLSPAIYSFQWYKGSIEEVDFDPNNFIIPGATSATFSPSSEGTYTVLATNRASGCRIPASTEVVSSYPPESIEVAIKSQIFSDNNTLEVTVVGTGVYDYRVDFGPWQRETLFENVLIGEHTIYVRDLLNCNEITQQKIVIGYPKFFTPNGDGYHDTWNIVGMTVKSSSKIYIFDRYGKLLKQLSPTGKGWDGTFNGERLPSSDYWFVLDYNEPVTGKINQLRANFTLKR